MSKVIYACLRNGADRYSVRLKRQIEAGASRIAPGSASMRPTRMMIDGGIVAAILNPSATVLAERGSVCLGHVAANSSWSEVGRRAPEGSYAICRSDDHTVELVADAVASRTLWYYFDSFIFVASTSQRWIAAILGDFQPNAKVLPWMLTTGTLGPTGGWDKRLERLQADSTLKLDRQKWTIELQREEVAFKATDVNAADRKEEFVVTLRNAFKSLELDYSKWVLPLSGGYDSRAILYMLPPKEGIRTVTWGTRTSLKDPYSDAAIATRLAQSARVPHEYFETDHTAGCIKQVFDDFVSYSEGRIDRISGYLDGFAIWQTLMDRGIEGIIRGDEGFGWQKVKTFADARRSVGLLLWSDFANLPAVNEFELERQELPDFLDLRNDETPSQWRDRLYHQYRIPTILAALTDPKSSYVEIANPLLTHSIIRAVRSQPDELRTEKRLFKEIVDGFGQAVPYAKIRAIASQRSVLRSIEAVDVLAESLASQIAQDIFSQSMITFIRKGLNHDTPISRNLVAESTKKRFRKFFAGRFKSKDGMVKGRRNIDFNAMAFRVYVTCRSYELLRSDADTGWRSRDDAQL
jgi:hypothetical protein